VVEGESNTAFMEELDRFNEKIKKEEEEFEPDFDISRNGKTMEPTLGTFGLTFMTSYYES